MFLLIASNFERASYKNIEKYINEWHACLGAHTQINVLENSGEKAMLKSSGEEQWWWSNGGGAGGTKLALGALAFGMGGAG